MVGLSSAEENASPPAPIAQETTNPQGLGRIQKKPMIEDGLDFTNEPDRSNSPLIVRAQRPWNAEPQLRTLIDNYITPEQYLFARNHSPIHFIDASKHITEVLDLTGILGKTKRAWSIAELKKLPKLDVTVTLQCAGNRRNDMSKLKKVNGVGWGNGSLGTCVWSGCKMRDVLLSTFPQLANMADLDKLCVAFEADGKCQDDDFYGSSIIISRALDPAKDVILAYEMNGHELTPDHGYPLRAIVPGYIAARSTKFLTHIRILPYPGTPNFYQHRDYKVLPPHVQSYEEADKEGWWDKLDACEAMSINSVICTPADGDRIAAGKVTIKGYALSGDGLRVNTVEVSCDAGKSWHQADIDYTPKSTISYLKPREDRYWAWCFWSLSTTRDDMVKNSSENKVEIVCRATDTAGNTQPAELDKIWNFRGVMCNSYCRVVVDV